MFNRFYAWATALIAESKDESGQTFVEYALVLVLVAVAVVTIGAFTGLAGAIQGAIQSVITEIGAA